MNKLARQAFTLIELLVVIAIIGILSGLIVVAMGGMTQKANIAKVQIFSSSVKKSLMLDLVSEWRFDENAGTSTYDSWSGGNVGTLSGTLPVWKTGSDCINGSCLQFGGGGMVSIADSNSLNIVNALTIGGWIKPTTKDRYNYIALRGYLYTTNHGWRVTGYPTTNKFVFSAANGSTFTEISSNDAYDINNWYYVVGTWNGSALKMYVNGVLQTGTATMVAPLQFEADKSIYIGTSLIGYLDEIDLYDVAITITQIKEKYYLGLNKMLINGSISKEEYLSRLNNYVSNN